MKSDNPITEIALWGPTGSGKSWLIHSFAKSLKMLNYKGYGFFYSLIDQNTQSPVFDNPPNASPTRGFVDFAYIFSRTPIIRDTPHEISASVHRIVIHDDKGRSLLERSEATSSASMAYSNFVIALLDPTQVTGENSRYTSSEYKELMKDLLQLEANNKKNEKKHIAICITKTDTLKLIGDPYTIMERSFGIDMLQMIRFYRDIMEIKLFPVSSAGWMEQDGKRISNYDPLSGGLLNPELWRPRNVEAPFFWFFEIIERKRIEENAGLFFRNRKDLYIPYPKESF